MSAASGRRIRAIATEQCWNLCPSLYSCDRPTHPTCDRACPVLSCPMLPRASLAEHDACAAVWVLVSAPQGGTLFVAPPPRGVGFGMSPWICCSRLQLAASGGGGGIWHKAWVSDCLPLAAPIGLSPLLILTLCVPERVLVVSTEPPDDLSCLTTPGVGRPGDGLLPVPLTRCIQTHTPSPRGGLPTPALTCARWGVHLRDNFPDRGLAGGGGGVIGQSQSTRMPRGGPDGRPGRGGPQPAQPR